MANHPMTLVGKNMLQEELDQLIKVDREEVKIAIAEAREHGDLKENAEYHAAKEKQSHIEGRIAELQSKLANANVIDVSKLDQEKVVFGATVTLFSEEKEESFVYQLVGEDEAQTNKNKISYSSPLGKSLLGKEEGDEVIVKAPKGDVHYVVEEIEYK
ncbi:MAG: transcription elongation factor GreA [Halobacteriovoraceae bacterium]|nr:transcription elongation factor GreA [Halobacteriovoraceae bacterium]|tara:strand:- start:163052 stop:163525 length:474 start_codon:yes stop_codon:yes gene_type:complete